VTVEFIVAGAYNAHKRAKIDLIGDRLLSNELNSLRESPLLLKC
jgi:hypothetical protein